jgi:carbohydrate-selective porin OprB
MIGKESMSTLPTISLLTRALKPLIRGVIAALAFASACSAQYHLETNYAEANPANDRPYLFGDPFGIRAAFAQKGITFNIESDTDTMGVAHGGLSDQPAAFTRIRGTIDIDFDKLTGKKHEWSFHATGLWQTGDNIGAKLGKRPRLSHGFVLGPEAVR